MKRSRTFYFSIRQLNLILIIILTFDLLELTENLN